MKIDIKYFTNKYFVLLILFAILISIWCLNSIYFNSFIAVDGKRYYTLFDDAMISMRYAWNFSHGNGLVWNPGERVGRDY